VISHDDNPSIVVVRACGVIGVTPQARSFERNYPITSRAACKVKSSKNACAAAFSFMSRWPKTVRFQSRVAHARRGFAPLHPGQAGGGGGPPISFSEIPKAKIQKVNNQLQGRDAPLPDMLLGKADRSSGIMVAPAASEATAFSHPSTDSIAHGPTVQRIEHEAVAAVSMHLLRAPSIYYRPTVPPWIGGATASRQTGLGCSGAAAGSPVPACGEHREAAGAVGGTGE
jgi:hypothetical protein